MLVIVAGGSASAFFSPSPRLRSSIQHFAGGLVFAAVCTGLLPEMLRSRDLVAVVSGFLLGIVLMVGMKWVTHRSGQVKTGQAKPMSLVFSAGVDYLVDGLVIGVGFVLGAKAGGLLTVALSMEGLFLAIAVSTALNRGKVAPSRLILMAIAFGLLLGVGAILGAAIFSRLSGSLNTAALAFGAAALIYLVTEELLVEAHEEHEPEDPLTVGVFFAGFLLLLTIEMSV